MDDLRYIEGKAVKTIEKDSNGLNSFVIIKFTDDSRLNIAAYPHGKKGVAQLDINFEEVETQEIKNRKIKSIVEEFDGEMDKVIIEFQGGGKMIVSAFNSKQDATAGIELTIYAADKKYVKESLEVDEEEEEDLEENTYSDIRWGDYPGHKENYESAKPKNNKSKMKKFVNETLNEFDDWYRGNDNDDEGEVLSPEEAYDQDSEDELDMDDVEGPRPMAFDTDDETDEIDDIEVYSEVDRKIDNSLKSPEYSREPITFRLKGSDEEIEAIPLTKMNNGQAVLFKTASGMRKIAINDIILESSRPRRWVSESLEDY